MADIHAQAFMLAFFALIFSHSGRSPNTLALVCQLTNTATLQQSDSSSVDQTESECNNRAKRAHHTKTCTSYQNVHIIPKRAHHTGQILLIVTITQLMKTHVDRVTPEACSLLGLTGTFPFFCLSPAFAQLQHDVYIKRRFNADKPGAVDVAFIIDESSSMGTAHAWINVMIDILEVELRKQGIGLSASTPNLYGIVGYGRPTGSSPSSYLGHTFDLNGKKLVPIPEFLEMPKLLESFPNGRVEDGYQAMEHAMLDMPFRTADNIERAMILITDEDRDRTPEGLHISRRHMMSLLQQHRFFSLNVVVDTTFRVNGSTALGMDSSDFGYLLNDQGEVVKLPSASLGRGYIRTNSDYSTVALELRGSAWNIQELRKFGPTGEAPALTAAFTQALASNIYELGNQCFLCLTSSGVTKCSAIDCQVGGKRSVY